ncbi:PrsW family intramembrane metalloprotease [Kutzneria viridogrisea]|uniref:RsiW-degrading membrane proteinase PrsW (M82 family) n=1 Tax=Kutzneria viridogrisea TaxID=47990 RepID=A0ABR6BWL8_9PSEU|nr:RsiW-degrading membrane proteinase PrsW (M82 family) [Kutzneria viridogrisea]
MTAASLSPPPRAPRSLTVLAPVLGLIALGLSALIMLGLGASKVGPMGVLVGAGAALLPVGPVVAAFLWVDRWEPEPAKLLWLSFAWGACGATACSLLINSTAEALGDLALGHGHGDTIAATISAPIVEEAAKAAFLIGLLWWRRQEFDGLVDGIVYAGFTAAGFAFTENIYYFGRVFAEYGFAGATGGVIAAFVLRGVLAPFTHPLFTAMTGIGVGIAARSTSGKVRVFAPLLGYVCAVLLHSLWNSSATLGGATAFLTVYFLVILPILASMIALVVWQRRREQRVVAAQLPGMAEAGWIANSEVSLLSSLTGRRGWRSAVRRRAGAQAARAVASYQTAATELAFLRDAVQSGRAGADAEQRQRHLLSAMLSARQEAVRAPGALTGES